MGDEFVHLVTVLSEVYDDKEIAVWLWRRDKAWGERYSGWKRYLNLISNGGLPAHDTYMSPLDHIVGGNIAMVIADAQKVVSDELRARHGVS